MLGTQWSGGDELATVTGCELGVEVEELLRRESPTLTALWPLL